jgi:hypothetical protein
MALRAVVTVTSLVAILAAGCGSSSSTTSSPNSDPAAVTRSISTTAATQAIPAGFARYQGSGFSFIAPSGMKPAPDGAISGLPPRASAVTLTPGGKRVENANVQIIEGINPALRGSLDAVALSLESADAGNKAMKNVHTSISTMTVSGAENVRVVHESYVADAGDGHKTLFHRTWLMVSPKRGTLMDLVVVDEPQRGGTLDPATVLDSFKLDHPA